MKWINKFKIENNILVTLTEKQFKDFWQFNLTALYHFSFNCDEQWFVNKLKLQKYYEKYWLSDINKDIAFLLTHNIIKDINEDFFICNPRIIGYKFERIVDWNNKYYVLDKTLDDIFNK